MRVSATVKFGIAILTLSACTDPALCNCTAPGLKGRCPGARCHTREWAGCNRCLPTSRGRSSYSKDSSSSNSRDSSRSKNISSIRRTCSNSISGSRPTAARPRRERAVPRAVCPRPPRSSTDGPKPRDSKGAGKAYDPLYDQFRAFVNSMSPNGSPQDRAGRASRNRRLVVKRRTTRRPGPPGRRLVVRRRARRRRGVARTQQRALRRDRTSVPNSIASSGSARTAAQGLKSEERARQLRAQEKGPLSQDMPNINLCARCTRSCGMRTPTTAASAWRRCSRWTEPCATWARRPRPVPVPRRASATCPRRNPTPS